MASSMLTAEVSTSASTESDVDKALKDALHTWANDPDFAIICDFLQKFSQYLGLDLPNFKLLLQWLTKTDEVSPQLRDMQIKLLRKTRKTVHEKSWESALSKFCFTYSAQDGWEIERFGYKNSSVKVKLRILRELLECQFERNNKFRAKILTLSADSLRSKPIGRDRHGHAYWVTQDNDCNIRIYQEHLDEEIWQVVATNRDEFVNLIKRLKGSEVVQPCKDIGIVDEDTSSSSHIDSDSGQKALTPEENNDSQEGEQKVPKLSIKLIHGKTPKQTTKIKRLGKGEEELAAEEDASLLKKSNNCSEALEIGEEEFEEIEEDYDDESEAESEEEINKLDKNSKKNELDQNLKKQKEENKKVKPLLISQNKVLNKEKCYAFSNTAKKRSSELMDLYSTTLNENQQTGALKKSRPCLLDSKSSKSVKNYEYNKNVIEKDYDDLEVQEEIEDEDIDSVAADEDENEEKMFEDYDDDEEEVGQEISDPMVHVSGEGSGKDCDEENYLYFMEYDLDNDNLFTLSEIIVEDVYYVHGDGNGRECLVGNKNDDNIINMEVKISSEISKTNVEEKSEPQSTISPSQVKNKTALENIDCVKLGTSKQIVFIKGSSNDTTNFTEDLDAKRKKSDTSQKNCNEVEEQSSQKEEIGHINGERKSNQDTLQTKDIGEHESDTNKATENVPFLPDINLSRDEKLSEDNKSANENLAIPNADSVTVDVLPQQIHASKMTALETVKKELRESKQKLLEKKLPQMSESSNINSSIYNRKRRLTDQLQTAARPLNSESEIDLNFENTDDLANDKEVGVADSGEDVGGKRLKMRSKQTNTKLRKKIEATKIAANDESTSSSGGEEDVKKRKKILPQCPPNTTILKCEEKIQLEEKKEDNATKDDKNTIEIDEKLKSAEIIQKSPPLTKTVKIASTTIKPTLTEIIEKKFKMVPEKGQSDLSTTDNESSNIVDTTTENKLVLSPNKSPMSNSMQKNSVTQIKQDENNKDTIHRKRTKSQELKTDLSETKSFETSIKCNEDNLVSKIYIERENFTRERQRKRRSSEETVQNDSPEEPEAKKEVAIIKDVAVKVDKPVEEELSKTDSKDFEIQKESSISAAGRRSGRRGKVVPTYVDNLQPKRYRGCTKSLEKPEKVQAINEKSYSLEANEKRDHSEKSIRNKSPDEKATSLPKENLKNSEKIKKISNFKTAVVDDPILKSGSTTKTPAKGVRKQREVDATNIIDVDSETPVRQSRRIAQQKIREEAERRKLEEIALRTMKQELKKKKKAEKQSDPTIIPPTEPSSDSEDSDIEIKRKVQKKKCPGKNGNWSSGSEEQEEPEEEEEDHHHYETDPGSPLFKSDHEFSPESDIEDESQVVPMKRARTVRKEDADAGATATAEEEACQKCNKSDHPEWILLCDNCDNGYHCSCLSPVLFYIPEGDWYCPPCQQEQLIKALENQLKEFDDLVETKKKADEQERRMIEEEKARKEREEETNKTKKDKRTNEKRKSDNSSTEDNSRQERDNGEATTNSDDTEDSDSKKQSSKNKNRNRSWNSKLSDKRNYRDRRHNVTRSRRTKLRKHETDSSDSQNSTKSQSESKSKSSSSSTYSDSDNEPIYKLRKRRQINVSYRLNEYDDLINSALKKEMDEAAGAGNLGRGKDISTIIEADKEEKARQKQIESCEDVINPKEMENDENEKETSLNSIKNEQKQSLVQEENENDVDPIIRKLNIKPSQKKKSRKLTTLDISSEDDDGSDEDFKGSSFDEEDEEDTSISASNSDSSLEIYKTHGKLKKKRRKAAQRVYRESRRDRKFFVDDSDDEEVQRPKSKKKRNDDSDYTESEADDDISELSENIDSADLCDDTTTDESDGAWRPNKKKKGKKSNTSFAQKSPKSKGVQNKKTKKVVYSDDDVSESEDENDDENDEDRCGKGMGKQPRSQPLKTASSSSKTKGKGKEKPAVKTKRKKSSEDETSKSDSEDSTRRTRGRRYAYIEDFDDDSSDGGIKPGVQRPDTPPEEREKFIKRQEEIKRMLAEKNAEGAKLVATPRLTPIKADGEKDKRSPAKAGGDSLSTVPLSVIRQAKVLDIDYLQRRGESLDDLSSGVGEVDHDFDDADLPDDLPEDMDEDAIARMVEEEEEFGGATTRDLPAPDEVLRTLPAVKPNKPIEIEKPFSSGSMTSSLTTNSPQVIPVNLPTPSGLQEPVRKRLPMPTIHPPLLRHQFLMHDSMPNNQHLMQRHGGATSQLLQNALSAPLPQSPDRNFPSTTAQHSLINRMTHSIPLQPTVSHTLSTTRSSQLPASSVIIKSSALLNQATQDKSQIPQNVNENKPRGRRKKITPLRDTLQKQQAAAAVTAATATSSALTSTLVKNNDAVGTSLLSSVIKSGSSPKLPMQADVITSMPPISHSATSRPAVPMSPISGSYMRTDGPRFYDTLGDRISQSSTQRHRGPPQMPPSLLPPHPANRASYGLPPPLKGSNSGHPVSSSSNTSGSIRNPIRHVPQPYLGMPPNARHSSHLNMYRPPIFGNPNFGTRVNLRVPNVHSADYSPSSRAYIPYGFYPRPPPLTAPVQRSGSGSISRPCTQMPPIQSSLTHPPASVIVSATSSKLSNTPVVTPQLTTAHTPELTTHNSISKSAIITQESSIKIDVSKSSSPTPIIAQTATMTVAEPRKKLTTLEAYVASSVKKSPVLPTSDSSGSRSPPNPPTDVNDDSSVPGALENASASEQSTKQEAPASEFSGLVSYFSSQHDDYNT